MGFRESVERGPRLRRGVKRVEFPRSLSLCPRESRNLGDRVDSGRAGGGVGPASRVETVRSDFS